MKQDNKKSHLLKFWPRRASDKIKGIDIFLYLDYSIERQGTQWENNIKQ